MSADGNSGRNWWTRHIVVLGGAMLFAASPAVARADNDFYQEPFGVLLTGEPVTDNNRSAGVQTGEPLTPAGPGTCGTDARKIVATKWYRFLGNGGPVSVDTVGSDFDTVIAAYEGPTPRSDDPLPCSDDAGGGRTSALSFQSVNGREYLIQVGGCSGCGLAETGAIVLNVSAAPPPPPPPPPPPAPPPPPPPPPVVIDAKATLTTDPYFRRVGRSRRIKYLGLKVRSLVVSRVPAGTRVRVRCTRGGCPRQEPEIAGAGRRVVFERMRLSRNRPRPMRAGVRIYITATLPGATGAHIRYRIGKNRLTKVQRCLKPGDPTPRKC